MKTYIKIILLIGLMLTPSIIFAFPFGPGPGNLEPACAHCHTKGVFGEGPNQGMIEISIDKKAVKPEEEITVTMKTSGGDNGVRGIFIVNKDQKHPARDGWEIVSDYLGKRYNYVEQGVAIKDEHVTWKIKAPRSPGKYTLMGRLNYGINPAVEIPKDTENAKFLLTEPIYIEVAGEAITGKDQISTRDLLKIVNVQSSLREFSDFGINWLMTLVSWLLFTIAVSQHLLRPYYVRSLSKFTFNLGAEIWWLLYILTRDLMSVMAFVYSLQITFPKHLLEWAKPLGGNYMAYTMPMLVGSMILGAALGLKLFADTERSPRWFAVFNILILAGYGFYTFGVFYASIGIDPLVHRLAVPYPR
ncbi:MAG: hypothetical protein HZC10_02635 [Nitrospirae bacterium]|nr:hypothetical protein [Nitrospirota bacterium]